MKIFIFQRINQVSYNYHPEGGLAIVAKDKDHALQLIEQDEFIKISKNEWDEVVIYNLNDDVEPRVFTFPDAGCC